MHIGKKYTIIDQVMKLLKRHGIHCYKRIINGETARALNIQYSWVRSNPGFRIPDIFFEIFSACRKQQRSC